MLADRLSVSTVSVMIEFTSWQCPHCTCRIEFKKDMGDRRHVIDTFIAYHLKARHGISPAEETTNDLLP